MHLCHALSFFLCFLRNIIIALDKAFLYFCFILLASWAWKSSFLKLSFFGPVFDSFLALSLFLPYFAVYTHCNLSRFFDFFVVDFCHFSTHFLLRFLSRPMVLFTPLCVFLRLVALYWALSQLSLFAPIFSSRLIMKIQFLVDFIQFTDFLNFTISFLWFPAVKLHPYSWKSAYCIFIDFFTFGSNRPSKKIAEFS